MTLQSPPHLPPQSCSIKLHYRLRFIAWVLLVVFLSCLSGIAAALSTIAWIVPISTPNTSLFSVDTVLNNVNNKSKIDPLVVQQTKQRILKLYKIDSFINEKYIPLDAYIDDVLMLSSDGWGVWYMPDFTVGEEKKLIGVDYQGVVHAIEEVSIDPLYGFVYFKFAGEGFRIMSFAQNHTEYIDRSVWYVHKEQWVADMLSEVVEVKHGREALPLWQERAVYKLQDMKNSTSGFAVNDRGELIGFLNEQGKLVPIWPIEESLSTILAHTPIVYYGLKISGFPIIAEFGVNAIQTTRGLYITEVSEELKNLGLEVGDILVSINKEPIISKTVTEHIMRSQESVEIEFMRGNETKTMVVSKVLLKQGE